MELLTLALGTGKKAVERIRFLRLTCLSQGEDARAELPPVAS